MSEEERYAKVLADKETAINESNKLYNDLLANNSALTEKQNQYADQYEKTQSEIADKNAAFQTEKQNQNQEKAQKEFDNEAIASKKAYYDFINPYGANAEIQASQGLNNSGYSETTQSGAWNTQQNRTAVARKSLSEATIEYNNAIKEIELNRDTSKSQYALEALKQKLDAAINEFNNASTLKQGQLSNNQALDSEYNNRYNTVWDQINTEKQQQEAAAQWQKEYQLSLQSLYNSSSNSQQLSGQTISTPYYQGTINSDTQYGTLGTQDANGVNYQPDNVAGSKLSSVGKVSKYLGTGNTGSTGANIDDQKVWSTNGRYYIWDGSQNKYIDVTSKIK